MADGCVVPESEVITLVTEQSAAEWAGKGSQRRRKERDKTQVSKAALEEQFMSERPVQARPRRLADWINPPGAKKVHSLIDKVYRKENLLTAWERVKSNGGSGVWIGRAWQGLKRSKISC